MKCVCLLVVLIGRLGRHGVGLVGMLNEVPEAVEHEFDPPAVQCESQAPPYLLEEDGLEHPMADVGELGMLAGVIFFNNMKCYAKKLKIDSSHSCNKIFATFFLPPPPPMGWSWY